MLKKLFIPLSLIFISIAHAEAPVSVTTLPPGMDTGYKLLQFLLPGKSAKLTTLDKSKKTFQLKFSGVAEKTTFFTNAPRRIEGTMNTEYFLKRWAKTGHDNYSETPPNLAVTYTNPKTGMRDQSVVQLTDPQYDQTKNELTVTIQAINDSFPVDLPTRLDAPEIIFASPIVCGLIGAWGDLPGETHYNQDCHTTEQAKLADDKSTSTTTDSSTTSTESSKKKTVNSGTIKYKDVDIYYETQGSGDQTILFIHGYPLSSECWECQQSYFSKNYKTVALDLPGYGKSSKLPNYKMEGLSEFYSEGIHAVLSSLKIDKVVYVGHATGGHVGMKFIEKYPEMVSKLVLVDTSPLFTPKGDWTYGFDKQAETDFLNIIDTESLEKAGEFLMSKAFKEKCTSKLAGIKDTYIKLAEIAGADTLKSFFVNVAYEDFRAILPKIKAPTLIVQAELDDLAVPAVAYYMQEKIPNAEVVEVHGADHFVYATFTSFFNEILENFINPQCTVCDYDN